MKTLNKIGLMILAIFTFFVVDFIFLPKFSFSSIEFWLYITFVISTTILIIGLNINKADKSNKVITISVIFIVFMLVILMLNIFISSRLFNAKQYSNMLDKYIVEGDISEYDARLDNVPLLDKDSAVLISNRELGGLADVVSQFELGENFQITKEGKPIRVTPLKYGGFFKWLRNRHTGTPGYIRVDMRTQEAELVRVDGGIKYSPYESRFSSRYLPRHIRRNYRTAIQIEYNFEIDETGKPYWVVPIAKYEIGLFGGEDVDYVLVVDATTGEIEKYDTGEVPEWVDLVYPTRMILQQYDNHGSLKNGFWNTKFSQAGVKVTTEGYNYIPLGNDIWVYTGVTSTGRDESNIGFILANKRTKEVIYYPITGAEEYSAMESAEGAVQHLGYTSTFPLLLNIDGHPTYVVALKDAGGLVKMYGMVNVEKYRIVVTGETIQATLKKYREALRSNEVEIYSEKYAEDYKEIEGVIENIKLATKDGTTYIYIKLDGSEKYYSLNILDNENIITYEIGDNIKLSVEQVDNKIVGASLLE